MPYYDIMPSPLGDMLVSSDGEALNGLWFTDYKRLPVISDWKRDADHPVLRATREQLDAYFAGELTQFSIPLSLQGTPFQQKAWEALLTIDYGALLTYGELAVRLGLPRAKARPVGGAVGRNPISIIVPCHRVVGQSGALTGYAGGLDRKRELLALERRTMADQQPEFELTALSA